mgnify:CR=1 FL=1
MEWLYVIACSSIFFIQFFKEYKYYTNESNFINNTAFVAKKNKLKEKYCDLIIANDVSKKNTGFNVDYNKVSLIDKKGKIDSIPKNKKSYRNK